jgi:hypothetical protein
VVSDFSRTIGVRLVVSVRLWERGVPLQPDQVRPARGVRLQPDQGVRLVVSGFSRTIAVRQRSTDALLCVGMDPAHDGEKKRGGPSAHQNAGQRFDGPDQTPALG